MFLPIDGLLVNAVSLGSGPRTLVAHGGWTGSWELWRPPFEQLSRTWRCVAYDHRGCGETPAPADSITADRLVDDLMAVLDAMDVERCVLAGESMGGVVAALAAERHPDRFEGLVLVSTPPFVDEASTAALVVGSRADHPRTVDAFVRRCLPEPDSEHLVRWGRHLLGRADPEAAARLLECLHGVRPRLDRLALPTLVIHGELDAIVPVAAATFVATAIPGARLEVLPRIGHVPTITAPDTVARLIETLE
ncbi:MAG: alpha/beta fold hydrolase [Alphaproteobacteria bacterium]|nr:alpha/beta fold hydrolase [Alphaproteobacteria bacterium]